MASRRGPDNSVRVAISGTIQGNNWANVFHCQLTTSSSISQSDLDAWTTSFQAAYKTNLGARQTSAAVYSLAKTVLYTPGGGELSSSVAMTGTGTEAGGGLNDNAAAKVISWLSGVYWRGGKPRTYLTGVATTDMTSGAALTATEITALTSAAAAFRTAVNALTQGTITGTTLGFVSFRTGNTDRTPPLFFAVSGARVHPRIGTQRRRLGRWLN